MGLQDIFKKTLGSFRTEAKALASGDLQGFTELVEYMKNLKSFEESVADRFYAIGKSPIINGLILRDIALTTSALEVPHRLGRVPLGFFVVALDSNATIFNVPSRDSSLYLNLQASATVTANLWVF